MEIFTYGQNFCRNKKINSKTDFIRFLNLMAQDFDKNTFEWENQTIPIFLEQIASWIDDYSTGPANDIDWEKIDYKVLAQIFYMGKIYE